VETLTWGAVRDHLDVGTPWLLSIGGTRGVRLGWDQSSGRLFVRLPAPHGTTVPPNTLAELDVQVRTDKTEPVLEVSTTESRLYREFHRFAGLLCEDFEDPKQTPFGAFNAALARWKEFTATRQRLTEEQQLGLFGELLTLEGVVKVEGASAISAWTGRDPQMPGRHDFRIGLLDLEVKTTRLSRRRHMIHGLGQLRPANGHKLFILSIRLEAAGAHSGRSLAEQTTAVRSRLGVAADVRHVFEAKLASAGYRDSDDPLYSARFILADPPRLIPVDRGCPQIVAPMISDRIPEDVAGRIDEVSYRVDLEGLGVAQGTDEYKLLLGDWSVDFT